MRGQLRAELLAAAEALVVAQGWRGLTMLAVARAVGVSRQTLYSEFANKVSLAHALVFARAEVYLDEHERVVARADDPSSALYETLCRTLELFAEDTLFKAVISPDDGGETFLPLYTSQSAPLMVLARDRMTVAFLARWPELDVSRLRWVIETLTRLAISHVVLPLHPPEQVAREATAVFGPALVAGSS
jgi:AcrR family transcriptional regulator